MLFTDISSNGTIVVVAPATSDIRPHKASYWLLTINVVGSYLSFLFAMNIIKYATNLNSAYNLTTFTNNL